MKIGCPILLNQQSSPPNTVHQMADIHGDYYTYGTQFDQIPPISTNFLHVFNTTPNGTFTETKWKQIPTTRLQSGNINADQEDTESHPSLTSNAFP